MILLALAAASAIAACTGSAPPEDLDSESSSSNPDNPDPTPEGEVPSNPAQPEDPDEQPIPEEAFDILEERVVDYNEALRTASLKLMRQLPNLDDIKAVEAGGQAEYEARVDEMLESPEFAARMVSWWMDIMRQGGNAGDDRNAAPAFAAQLIVEGRPFMEVLTADSNNCATFDAAAGTFAAATCNGGAPVQAGVLTNPGVMRQFYGQLAFRRVRWVQEIFACKAFPAEATDTAQTVGEDGKYFGPWPFDSISNTPTDFLYPVGNACANCHQTLNHMAPLFGKFNADGMWMANGYGVNTVVGADEVPSELSHWLPEGEQTAWRFGKPAADLPALGALMAEDPIVHSCVVSRAWNFVMSKEDIVSDGANVAPEVLEPFVLQFQTGYNLKETLRAMFKSDDYIKR
ncbi:MAG TPA: DUF1549 domain-containing protein [Candidatus Nanopelagicales bacterium]|nr:DUF1549 domain-containing protein [Candidatus Nanopelagicales bacterium]